MKRKTTREILAESFKELADRKPVSKITIRDITDNCDFSPATFYRCFRDKYDLIAWDYTMHCNAIIAQLEKKNETLETVWTESCRYFYDQRVYLQNLLQNTSGHESFLRYMTAIHTDLLSKAFLKKTGKPALPEEKIFDIKLYCYGTVMLICEWLMESCPTPVEHLSRLLADALQKLLTPLSL